MTMAKRSYPKRMHLETVPGAKEAYVRALIGKARKLKIGDDVEDEVVLSAPLRKLRDLILKH